MQISSVTNDELSKRSDQRSVDECIQLGNHYWKAGYERPRELVDVEKLFSGINLSPSAGGRAGRI
jgi:hypothetical protein